MIVDFAPTVIIQKLAIFPSQKPPPGRVPITETHTLTTIHCECVRLESVITG